MSFKTAAVIVVCKFHMTNSLERCAIKFLTHQLDLLDYEVTKISILQCNVNLIKFELESVTKQVDVIIVIGDSLTPIYLALSKLFCDKLYLSSTLTCLASKNQENMDRSEFYIPRCCNILTMKKYAMSVVYSQRVFISKLELFEDTFNYVLKSHLEQYRKERIFIGCMDISLNGKSYEDTISEITKYASKNVQIEIKQFRHQLNLKISSTHVSKMIKFQKLIKDTYNVERIRFHHNWDMILSTDNFRIQHTLTTIEQAFKQFGPENTFLCFNGGKDCTVLLHLIKAKLYHCYPKYKTPLFCLYIQSEHPFLEQEEFINECKEFYNLDILVISSGIKEALKKVLSLKSNFRACFMGTRRTDPFSNELNVFQMTDPDWPQIIRVSPLLEWHYNEIWDYLLYYKVPYCTLYDMGYTSLGNVNNTVKNPSLLYYDIFEEKNLYLPAYKLLVENTERNGRGGT